MKNQIPFTICAYHQCASNHSPSNQLSSVLPPVTFWPSAVTVSIQLSPFVPPTTVAICTNYTPVTPSFNWHKLYISSLSDRRKPQPQFLAVASHTLYLTFMHHSTVNSPFNYRQLYLPLPFDRRRSHLLSNVASYTPSTSCRRRPHSLFNRRQLYLPLPFWPSPVTPSFKCRQL